MQFYYDNMMPLRILDEGEFWKHQEAEHTQVIRALVPNLEPAFVHALASWEMAFHQTHGEFVRSIETVIRMGHHVDPAFLQQIMYMVGFALAQSQQFIALLDQLMVQSVPIRQNQTAQTVILHIRRESEYFIGIAQALLTNT